MEVRVKEMEGAWPEQAVALMSLLFWLEFCCIWSSEGETERPSSLSLCPVIKSAIWVCIVIAGWDSVEMCLRAMFCGRREYSCDHSTQACKIL